VAIGDSYTSGEGVPPFESASDRDGVNECHRSSLSYPMHLGTMLGVPVDVWACSGATAGDLSTTVVRTDQAPWDDPILEVSGGTPSSALDRVGLDTAMVTLTVGGNDLGFADIVSDCLLGLQSCTDTMLRFGRIWPPSEAASRPCSWILGPVSRQRLG
jgi:hypothetical protein